MTRTSSWSPALLWRRSTDTRTREGGHSPGTRRSEVTSTTTFMSPSTDRSHPSCGITARWRSSSRSAMGWLEDGSSEQPGYSTFLRQGDAVFHTYSVYARGTEMLGGSYYFLDMTALGRQEEWEEPKGRVADARANVPDFST